MHRRFYNRLILLLGASAGLFLIESVIKYHYILNKIPKQGFYLFYHLLQIGLFPNKNAAFGLPIPQVVLLGLIILILLGLLYGLILAIKRQKAFEVAAFLFLIIGAVSNLLDRFLFGFVIDYINLFFWPVFNLADAYIVCGVLLYILSEFKKK